MSSAPAALASAFDPTTYRLLLQSGNTDLPSSLSCLTGTIPAQLSDQPLQWDPVTAGLPFTHSDSQSDTASPENSLMWSYRRTELGNMVRAGTPTTVDSRSAGFFGQRIPVEDAAKDIMDLDTFAFLEGLRVASGSAAGMPVEPGLFPLPSFRRGLAVGLQLRGQTYVEAPPTITDVSLDLITLAEPVLPVANMNTRNTASLQDDDLPSTSLPSSGVAFDGMIKIPTLPDGWPTASVTPCVALSLDSPVRSPSLSFATSADPLLPSPPSSLSPSAAQPEPNSGTLRPSPTTFPSSRLPSETPSSALPQALSSSSAEPDILKSFIVLVLHHTGRVLTSEHIREAIVKLDDENGWGWVESQTRTSAKGWRTTVQETLAKNPQLFVKVHKCHRSPHHNPDACRGTCNPLPPGHPHHPVAKGQGWVLAPHTSHTARFWSFAATYMGWNDIGTWLDEQIASGELEERPTFMSAREEGTLRRAVDAARRGGKGKGRRGDVTAPRQKRERRRRNHVVSD